VPVDPVGQRGVYDPDSFLIHVSYCGVDYKVFERIRLVRGSDIVLVIKVITGRKGDENKVSCLDAILSGRTAAGQQGQEGNAKQDNPFHIGNKYRKNQHI
jgi:hypothetical protein